MTYQAQGPLVIYINDVVMTEEPFLTVHPTKGCTKTTIEQAEVLARMLNERDDLMRAEHTYPSAYPKGTIWAMDEAWRCLDKLKPGLIDDDVRAFIVGFMAAALGKAHDAGLERAAAYHDEEARDCRSIAAVNEDNELGPDCTDYAIQHDADAEAIRALKQAERVVHDTSDIPESGEDFFMSSKLRTPSDPM